MVETLLAPGETVTHRPFTSVHLYERDHALLTAMLDDLQALLGAAAAGTTQLVPHKRLGWKAQGLRRRVIVCDPVRLREGEDVCVVGFFAERRPDLDLGPLEAANAKIVGEFRSYPGILSYSSWELPGSNWANLVVHDAPEAAEQWRASAAHARAVDELSPRFYRNVRIHNGRLPGGVPGGRPIAIERTKYLDFEARRVWRAVRELPPDRSG